MADVKAPRQQKRFVPMICPHCDRFTDFPPGRPDDEEGLEYRTCPDCGKEVTTPLYVDAKPSEAEVWD